MRLRRRSKGVEHDEDLSGAPEGPPASSVPALTVTIVPGTVARSTDKHQSVACLQLRIKNDAGTRWETSKGLSIDIPTGTGQPDLTVDPTSIGAAPGALTPWAIAWAGGGGWRAVPLPPATGMEANATIVFELTDIVVNKVPGPATITVTDLATSTQFRGSVRKGEPDSEVPAANAPVIESFDATPAQVAEHGTTTLTWKVKDAVSCVLLPGPVPLPDPTGGSLPMIVDETTIHTLRAIGAGGTVSRDTTVTVMPVAIGSFAPSPLGPVAEGAAVTLAWSVAFATAASIDQGIGIVPLSGTTVVTPEQTTVYTLTAHGREPQTVTVTVTVT